MKLNLLDLFALLAFPFATASAADVNMKWGKPTQEEMQMTVYDAEPNAEAVVLCRLTEVEYTVQTNSYLVDYHEKMRIKVLKPSGTRFAKVVVPYKKFMSVGNNIGGLRTSFATIPMNRMSGDSYFGEESGSMSESVFGTDADENVENVKATAFNLEGSKVAKTSMKKSSIATKQIDEHNYQLEFTVPNVKEGTVIEYAYTIHSQIFWELHDWYAQWEIPVVFAKLDMNIPNYLIFNIEDHGIENYGMMLNKKVFPKTMLGLLLSIGFLAVGAGLSLLFYNLGIVGDQETGTGKLNELVIILTITTLSIIASFSKKIRELPKTFELGMIFILIFSIAVASQFNPYSIDMSAISLGLFVLYIMLVSVIIHIIFCRFSKINGDLYTVAQVGLFCSPPFIPPVVGAMGNKKVLISGIVIGLIGYAIGTYMGVGIAYLLKLF